MSASKKKQLRNELNAAAMTEKQQKEQADAKKLRLYTILFTAAIILMVCIVVVTTVVNSGIIQRSTTAVTVGDTKVSAAELNHYYVDIINNYVSQFGDYIALTGIDTTKPLNEQFYNEEEGMTWADYFLESATTSIRNIYAHYNAAMAEGYTLSEDASAEIDSSISMMGLYATAYGYTDANSYIGALYGAGCNEETYRHYCEVQYIASDYATDHSESLTYTDEDLRAAEAENHNAYSSYDYNYYYLSAVNFYEGGTADEEGNITYSDEEKAAGLAACEAAANSLISDEINTPTALDLAIAHLDVNADSESPVKSSAAEDYMYSSVNSVYVDWIASADRVAGDVAVFPNETNTTDADGNTVTNTVGYYVVMFNGANDNTFPLANVRHILVSFEGGTTDDSGNVTYTDEEKAAAKAAAEEILAGFTAGEATEEAFAALANEKSTDTGSNTNGGLYENVYPGQMVEPFETWCFDEARQPGDTGIVETSYGYHVMYYSGDSLTYRDYMITNDLRTADMEAWSAELTENSVMEVKSTSHVAMDLTLGG